MLHFTVTNLEGEKVQVQSPSDYNELTLGQLLKIEGSEEINVLETFAILSGLDLTIPEQSTDKKLEANIWRVVEFLTRQPDWKTLAMPALLEVGGKAYPVPRSFKKMTVGQEILIGHAVKNVEDVLLKIPDVLAIIFQPQIKGPDFKSKDLPDIRKAILNCNALHCYAIAVFFLSEYENFTKVWADRFAGVPVPIDSDGEICARLADQNRLGGFGDLRRLNDIVVRSKGAYTHETAYELEADFANSLALMYYETEMFERRYMQQQALLNSTKKPKP